MLGKILLHCLIGLKNIHRQHEQTSIRKFFGDVIDQRRFLLAILAPASPELE
jgi:hypothetical protein